MTPRVVISLLLKELHHHWIAFAGTAFLLAALLVTSLSFTLTSEVDTLLTAATGFSYYGMPFAIAYIVRRLVVFEHEDHTHDFLAALPVTALARVSVKYFVGLAFTWTAAVLSLWFIAALVCKQEIIGLGWLFQVTWQVCAYTFAWYGITFGAAHLGRYRFSFWLCLMPLVFTLDVLWPDVWNWGLWQAVLADSVDVTRYLPPWRALAVTLAWGLSGTFVGFFLGIYRSGSVADEWYRPMTSQEKAMLIVGVVGVWMLLDVIDSVVVPGGPTYSRLSVAGEGSVVVRVAAERGSNLWESGEQLADQLNAFAEELDLGGWPTIVLVANPQEAEDAVALRSSQHGEVVLEIDPDERRHVVLRDAFEGAIGERAAWFPWWRSGRSWVAAGAPLWWLGPDPARPDSYALRAGYAASKGLTVDDLEDGHALRYRFGGDVTAGISWAGLKTLERLAGRAATVDLLAAVLGPRPTVTLFGAIRTDMRSGDGMLRRTTGLDPDQFRKEWLAELQQHHSRHREAIQTIDPGWGEIHRTKGIESAVVLEWTWPGEVPDEAEILWLELDPLQELPILGQDIEDRTISDHEGRVPTNVDPRAKIATAFEVQVDKIDGLLLSGFVVDP